MKRPIGFFNERLIWRKDKQSTSSNVRVNFVDKNLFKYIWKKLWTRYPIILIFACLTYMGRSYPRVGLEWCNPCVTNYMFSPILRMLTSNIHVSSIIVSCIFLLSPFSAFCFELFLTYCVGLLTDGIMHYVAGVLQSREDLPPILWPFGTAVLHVQQSLSGKLWEKFCSTIFYDPSAWN